MPRFSLSTFSIEDLRAVPHSQCSDHHAIMQTCLRQHVDVLPQRALQRQPDNSLANTQVHRMQNAIHEIRDLEITDPETVYRV